MRKLLNLLAVSMVLSSASYAQDKTATSSAEASMAVKQVTPISAPYDVLSSCLEHVELKKPYQVNILDEDRAGRVRLSNAGYEMFRDEQKPQLLTSKEELRGLDTLVIERTNKGLEQFKVNFKNKLKEIASSKEEGREIKRQHVNLMFELRKGLCACEKAGFDKQKIRLAKESVISKEEFKLKLDLQKDGFYSERKITAEDLACQ